MPDLIEITSYLNKVFNVHLYPNDQNGIVIPSTRNILRMGIGLEPWDGINSWIIKENLDAVFLHRPWKLNKTTFPLNIGVLAYHLPFDEQLTIGYNLLLAEQLQMQQIQPFGEKENRPLGMIGQIQAQHFTELKKLVELNFGFLDEWHQGIPTVITRIAAVGAMTDALVRTAVENGAQVYITGQFRKPARQAVIETGIHVLAVGHQKSEIWGLHKLASILQQQWPSLEMVLAKHQT